MMMTQRGNLKTTLLKTLLLSIVILGSYCTNLTAYSQVDYNKLLRTKSCMKCDLDGAPLSGINLSYANLQGASLIGANLRQATLYKAVLPSPRKYIGTNFTGAMWVDGRICRSGSIGKCTCKAGDWSEQDLSEECK